MGLTYNDEIRRNTPSQEEAWRIFTVEPYVLSGAGHRHSLPQFLGPAKIHPHCMTRCRYFARWL